MDPLRRFLDEHPLIVDALDDIHHIIAAQFILVEPPSFALRIYSNDENDVALVVTIPVKLDVESALARLDVLDEAWIDQPDEVRSLVVFDVDYR